MHLYILLHYHYLFQLYNKCMGKKKPKHVRMSTGRGLAAEEINKNTWKHIIQDSLSSALLGPQLKDIQGCLPLLYIKLATARESTGKGNQSWPECVLWAELTTANDVKGKSKEKAEQSVRCCCDPGCIHTANQTGLKKNLSPKLFTLQSVKGHIFKLTWTATRIWGKKVWSRPLGLCECVRSTSTRFPDKSECLMLIKCLVIC